MSRSLLAIALSCCLGLTACERLDLSIDQPAATPVATTTKVGDEASDSGARALLNQAQLQPDLVAPVPYDRDDYSPRGWGDSDSHIEAVAAVVASVRDVTSRNRYTVNDERRTGANIEPGQDWDLR